MLMLIGGGNYCLAQETALLKFTKACGGKGTDNKGGAWTVASDATEVKDGTFDTRGIHYGTSKKPVSYIKVSTKAYSDKPITKIVVHAATASRVDASVKCEVGGAAFGVAQKLTSTDNAYTFEDNASGDILVSVYKPESKKGALYILSVEITYSTANLETTTLTLTAPDSPISIGGTYTSTPTLKAGEQTLSDKTITWSSDNENVATVEANTGVVTGIGVGTAKITAKFAGDDEYKQSTASYEIKVKGAPALSFPKESYDEIVGETFEAPQLEGLPKGVAVQYTSSNDKVATVDPTGDVTIVGVGTTTITATSEAKDIYEVATASYKLMVKPAISKEVTIDFSNLSYTSDTSIDALTDWKDEGITMTFKNNGGTYPPKWYKSDKTMRLYKKNTFKILSDYRIKKIEFQYGSTVAKASNPQYSCGTYDVNKKTLDLSAVKTKEVTLTFSSAVHYKKIIVTTIAPASSVGTITIATPEGFGTYYNSNSYILPKGLTAFGYKEANTDGTLVKTEEFTGGDVVPANAALVVKGNEGEYECYATDQVATKTLEGNLLKGVAKATTVEKTEGIKRYVLTTVNGVLGFYQTKSGNIKVPANRAYLELTKAQAQAVSFFQLDGETTGIENATATTKEAPKAIYTLSGVRLKATTTQGLPAGAYVVNGKVVIVK